MFDLGDHVGVLGGQDALALVNEEYAGPAEAAEDGGVLAADYARAHDHQRRGELLQVFYAVAAQDVRLVDEDAGQVARTTARGKDDVVRHDE